MNDFNPHDYGILIRRQLIEGNWFYVGSVIEFPDVEVFEESHAIAYESLVQILTTLKAAADRNGKFIPSPLLQGEDEHNAFSGRVTLRMTRTLHRKVTEIARKETVSLNQWLLATVAEKVGGDVSKPNHPLIVHHLITAQTAISAGQLGNQKYMITAQINAMTN